MFQQIERSAAQVNSLAYKLTKAQQLANPQTQKPTKSQTHKLTNKLINPLTHQLINSKTQKLKNLNRYLLFYNIALIFAPF